MVNIQAHLCTEPGHFGVCGRKYRAHRACPTFRVIPCSLWPCFPNAGWVSRGPGPEPEGPPPYSAHSSEPSHGLSQPCCVSHTSLEVLPVVLTLSPSLTCVMILSNSICSVEPCHVTWWAKVQQTLECWSREVYYSWGLREDMACFKGPHATWGQDADRERKR